MSSTIWKFPLDVVEEQSVELPEGADLLHVGMQGASVCLWARVDPNAPRSYKVIRIYGTGHPMPDDPRRYLGTVMLRGGALVLHVFVASAS